MISIQAKLDSVKPFILKALGDWLKEVVWRNKTLESLILIAAFGIELRGRPLKKDWGYRESTCVFASSKLPSFVSSMNMWSTLVRDISFISFQNLNFIKIFKFFLVVMALYFYIIFQKTIFLDYIIIN